MSIKGQSLTGGAAVLLISAIGVKVIGALFKIPLTNRIKGIGMGYYMTAYSVFNPVYAVSVAGFPTAIARVTAMLLARGGDAPSKRITRNAFAVFLPIGAAFSALLFVFADEAAAIVANPGAESSIRAISPAVFFCCLSSVLRGSFEGRQNMIPTAVSQLMEAAVKLAAGLLLVDKLLKLDTDSSPSLLAAAALTGVSVSCLAGFIMLLAFYRPQKSGMKAAGTVFLSSDREIRRLLISAAAPVSLAALATNLTSLIDLITVMKRLAAAMKRDAYSVCLSHPDADLWSMAQEDIPNFLFGSYTALAMTVFHLVPALTVPLCTSALPLVSRFNEGGKRRDTRLAVAGVIKAAVLFAVPAGMGIAFFSKPILLFLFPDNVNEAAVASVLLRPLGAAAAFAAISSTVNSMLQAVGRPYVPVRLMTQAAALKLCVNILLISVPGININAAAWGTLICYAFMALKGLGILLRDTAPNINPIGIFLIPLVGGTLCILTAEIALSVLENMLSPSFALMLSIGAAAAVYLAFLILLRPFSPEESALLLSNIKK